MVLYNISTRRSVYEKAIQTITGRFAFGNAVADGGSTLLLTAATFASSAAEMAPQEESVGAESGKTGDCTWTLDNTGTLTISGNGAMKDYSSSHLSDASPWGPWTGLSVKKVVIGGGVTHIGDFAFLDCIRLTSVSIPDSVTSIGGYAFYNCTGLTSVSIPDSVTTIDRGGVFRLHGLDKRYDSRQCDKYR